MSFWKKLFGGGGAAPPESTRVEYEGFTITPSPMRDAGKWRVSARIEGPEGQVHEMIRADTLDSQGAAAEASVLKAKQFIDQQGRRIFD
ncbi:MAG: HlyU family transcriptional regulator [Shimia sp.]